MQLNDEIDFKELLKNPVRLFGLTYVYFLLIGGILGAYYIMNMNTISNNGIEPVVLRDSSQFVVEIPISRGAVISPVDVKQVSISTKVLVEKGANLFKSNCVSCHGDNGMGDGLSAAALIVKPRNFHSTEGWKNGRKISQMYKTLQEGIVVTGMASYNYLPAEDLFALIHYVRSFVNTFPMDSLNEIIALETTYNLSKGSTLAPQIPIKMAMQKIVQENDVDVKFVNEQVSAIKKNEDVGSKLTASVSRNLNKVLTTASKIAGSKSVDEFIKIVSSDPNTIGFKSEVVRLSSEEWNTLYLYLSKLSREKKS